MPVSDIRNGAARSLIVAVPSLQPLQDPAPGGIREGRERAVELILNHLVQCSKTLLTARSAPG